MGKSTCSIGGCSKPVLARHWCSPHYASWLRCGSPYGKPAVPLVPLPDEQWMPVAGWADLYQVSDHGRVRSIRSGRFIGWTIPSGYRQVTLCDGTGNNEHRYVHDLVAEAFIGLKPAGQDVRHLDGKRDHNVRTNLAYGTRSENILDAVGHGTHFQAAKTHCPQDHEYTEANTYITTRGGRICRTCSSEAKRAYKQRQKMKAAA